MSQFLRHGILKQNRIIPFTPDSSFYTTYLAYGWDLDGDYTRINNQGASLRTETGIEYVFGESAILDDTSSLYIDVDVSGYYWIAGTNASTMACFDANKGFTYSIWVREGQTTTSHINNSMGYLWGDTSLGEKIGFTLDTYTGNHPRAKIHTSYDTPYFIADASFNFHNTGPHMLTATWDGSTKTENYIKLYIDGSLWAQTQTYGAMGWKYVDVGPPLDVHESNLIAKRLFINCQDWDEQFFTRGTMERIRIWPCVLDAETIKWVYDTKY